MKLQPDEIWLLIQLCRQGQAPDLDRLATELSIPRQTLTTVAERLQQALATRKTDDELVATDKGRQTFERIVESFRQRLAQFVEPWTTEDHAEVRNLLESFARDLVDELPRERAAIGSPTPAASSSVGSH